MALPPHPLLDIKSLRKQFTDRDELVEVPAYPTQEEADLLLEMYRHYMYHGGQGLNADVWFGQSFRGQSPQRKLLATRCQWFGWLAGRTWERVGGVKPDGLIILIEYLLDPANGTTDYAKARRSLFRSDWEIDADLKRHDAAVAKKAKADQASYERREAHFNANDAHRRRQQTAEHILMTIARDLGAGRINDIDGALEKLRQAEKALQAEEVWTNPTPLSDD